MKWLRDIPEQYRLHQSPVFRKLFGGARPIDPQGVDEKIIARNLLGEGPAFDFYRNEMPISERLKILGGLPCDLHADDSAHELDLGDDVAPGAANAEGGWSLWQSVRLYHQMLSAWIEERVGALKQT